MNLLRKQIFFLITVLLLFSLQNKGLTDNITTGKNDLTKASNTWDNFVKSLREGNFSAAYSLLSPSSRRNTQYREFCVKWHPVNTRYNVILSNPDFSEFSVFGNIAAVRIGILPHLIRTENEKFLRILLINQDNKWWIVDDKVITETVADAAIRGVLKDMVKESSQLNQAFTTGKGNINEIKKEVAHIFSAQRGKLAEKNYSFELDLLRDSVLRAIPSKTGLQGYEINKYGTITTCKTSHAKIISSQNIIKRRQLEKEKQRKKIAEEQKKQLLLARQSIADIKNKEENTTGKETKTTPAIAELPDEPPEFPKNFSLQKSNESEKTIIFLGKNEEFDLPEISSIDFISKNKELRADMSSLSPEKQEISAETQTMAASADGQIHPTKVDLNNEQLLNELENMLQEYQSDQ